MVGIVRHSQSENLRKLFALPSLVTGLRGPNSRVRAFISVLLGGQPRSSKLASTKNRSVMDVTDTSFRPPAMAGRRRDLEPGGSLCRKRGCHAATDTVRYR